MENYLSVKDFAKRVDKSEETIKRWIRSGKISNAIKENDRRGWLIPEGNIYLFNQTKPKTPNVNLDLQQKPQQDDRELVNLAYQAVTMTSPTEELLGLLSDVGIKRTLEILLIMQQSPTKVKNPSAFIKRAISKGWSPSTIPIKNTRNISRIKKQDSNHYEYPQDSPFYNWLDS